MFQLVHSMLKNPSSTCNLEDINEIPRRSAPPSSPTLSSSSSSHLSLRISSSSYLHNPSPPASLTPSLSPVDVQNRARMFPLIDEGTSKSSSSPQPPPSHQNQLPSLRSLVESREIPLENNSPLHRQLPVLKYRSNSRSGPSTPFQHPGERTTSNFSSSTSNPSPPLPVLPTSNIHQLIQPQAIQLPRLEAMDEMAGSTRSVMNPAAESISKNSNKNDSSASGSPPGAAEGSLPSRIEIGEKESPSNPQDPNLQSSSNSSKKESQSTSIRHEQLSPRPATAAPDSTSTSTSKTKSASSTAAAAPRRAARLQNQKPVPHPNTPPLPIVKSSKDDLQFSSSGSIKGRYPSREPPSVFNPVSERESKSSRKEKTQTRGLGPGSRLGKEGDSTQPTKTTNKHTSKYSGLVPTTNESLPKARKAPSGSSSHAPAPYLTKSQGIGSNSLGSSSIQTDGVKNGGRNGELEARIGNSSLDRHGNSSGMSSETEMQVDAEISPHSNPFKGAATNDGVIARPSLSPPPVPSRAGPSTDPHNLGPTTESPHLIRQPLVRTIAPDTGLKAFLCTAPNCGKSFKRSEHLRRHERSLHTNSKPFACSFPLCQKRFNRSDNLIQHQRLHEIPGSSVSNRDSLQRMEHQASDKKKGKRSKWVEDPNDSTKMIPSTFKNGNMRNQSFSNPYRYQAESNHSPRALPPQPRFVREEQQKMPVLGRPRLSAKYPVEGLDRNDPRYQPYPQARHPSSAGQYSSSDPRFRLESAPVGPGIPYPHDAYLDEDEDEIELDLDEEDEDEIPMSERRLVAPGGSGLEDGGARDEEMPYFPAAVLGSTPQTKQSTQGCQAEVASSQADDESGVRVSKRQRVPSLKAAEESAHPQVWNRIR